jgi:hypothetical protein
MAAITVKRKPKIGFREEAQPEVEAPEAAPEQAAAPVLSRYDSVSDGSSYVFAGICGLIAMFIFLALLFIQYTEHTYYQDAFILSGAYVSAPSVASSAPAARAPAPAAAVAAPAATPAASEPAAPAPAKKDDSGGSMRSKVDGRNAEVDAAVESK